MNSSMENMLKKRLGDVEQLPTLPTVYYRLQKLLSDPNVSAKEVGDIISPLFPVAWKALTQK